MAAMGSAFWGTLTVENTPKYRPRPQKAGAAGPQKTGRKLTQKKMKKGVDNLIN